MTDKYQGYHLQIRQIQYNQIEALMNIIDVVMYYQIGVQKYQGKNAIEYAKRSTNMFKNLFEFWLMDHNGIYSLFIAEEKIKTTLKDFLSSINDLNQRDQKSKCRYICYRIQCDILDMFYDQEKDGTDGTGTHKMQYLCDFNLDNIRLRIKDNKLGAHIEEIPVYYFRKKNMFQVGNLNDDVKRFINAEKIKHSLFYSLKTFSQQEEIQQLQFVIENTRNSNGDYLYKYDVKCKEQQIPQKSFDKSKYYKTKKILGKGAFGIVFSLSVEDKSKNEKLALKQVNKQSLKDLSILIIESQFHLFFTDDNIPLIKLKDIFMEKIESKFRLNLVMAQAECELDEFLKQKDYKLHFFDKFSIFKDSILGLCYMNSNRLAHRDIKPQNILVVHGRFCLADYGAGINLYYESQQNNKVYFQVGKWCCSGTPNYYCDPIIKHELNLDFNNPEDAFIDLFKADIYSLGVTLLKIMTNKSIGGINEKWKDQEFYYKEIHRLKLPIQMKNTILHMIQFESSNRISVLGLHSSLKNLMQRITNSTQLNVLKQLSVKENEFYEKKIKFDHINHDWFINKGYNPMLARDVKFDYQQIKAQTNQDQTFFSGDQRIDFNQQCPENQKQREFKRGQIVIIKPNFLLCYFVKRISNDESRVMLNNDLITVKYNDIQTIMFQHFKQKPNLQFYDQDNNEWVQCKVKNHPLQYEIEIEEKDEKMYIHIDTLKLRNCLCLQCIINNKGENIYGSMFIPKKEKKLLSWNRSIINSEQLFNVYEANLYDDSIIIDPQQASGGFKKWNYNIFCYGKKKGSKRKLNQLLLSKGLINMLYLQRIKLNQNHLNVLQSGSVKMLKLYQCDVTLQQLVTIFKIFTFTKLQRLYLDPNCFEFNKEPAKQYLDELKQSFTQFSYHQTELYDFYFHAKFKGTENLSCSCRSLCYRQNLNRSSYSFIQQFKDIFKLINHDGYRFQKGKFGFYISANYDKGVNCELCNLCCFCCCICSCKEGKDTEVFSRKIKNALDQQHKKWQCENQVLYRNDQIDTRGQCLKIKNDVKTNQISNQLFENKGYKNINESESSEDDQDVVGVTQIIDSYQAALKRIREIIFILTVTYSICLFIKQILWMVSNVDYVLGPLVLEFCRKPTFARGAWLVLGILFIVCGMFGLWKVYTEKQKSFRAKQFYGRVKGFMDVLYIVQTCVFLLQFLYLLQYSGNNSSNGTQSEDPHALYSGGNASNGTQSGDSHALYQDSNLSNGTQSEDLQALDQNGTNSTATFTHGLIIKLAELGTGYQFIYAIIEIIISLSIMFMAIIFFDNFTKFRNIANKLDQKKINVAYLNGDLISKKRN